MEEDSYTKKPGHNAGLSGMLKPQCNRMAQAGQASIFQQALHWRQPPREHRSTRAVYHRLYESTNFWSAPAMRAPWEPTAWLWATHSGSTAPALQGRRPGNSASRPYHGLRHTRP